MNKFFVLIISKSFEIKKLWVCNDSLLKMMEEDKDDTIAKVYRTATDQYAEVVYGDTNELAWYDIKIKD